MRASLYIQERQNKIHKRQYTLPQEVAMPTCFSVADIHKRMHLSTTVSHDHSMEAACSWGIFLWIDWQRTNKSSSCLHEESQRYLSIWLTAFGKRLTYWSSRALHLFLCSPCCTNVQKHHIFLGPGSWACCWHHVGFDCQPRTSQGMFSIKNGFLSKTNSYFKQWFHIWGSFVS